VTYNKLEDLPFKYIVAADFEFEFGEHDGERPRPVCMVAKELRSGQGWRIWRGEFDSEPPFPIGPDALFVAYFASAELGCFRALGWPMPARILDLFTEFSNHVNGIKIADGSKEAEKRSLINALLYFGADTIGAHYKKTMIDLILRGPPWSGEGRQDIFEYCAGDVYALERLLLAMLPYIDLPRALLRGRYMAAVSAMEFNGVPIDTLTLELLREHWDDIKSELVAAVDGGYGVYEGNTFKENLFENLLIRRDIPWPLLDSGKLDMKQKTFREMAKMYPIISPIYELRHTMSHLRLNDLTVGFDGRNRTILGPFGSKSGRNQPSNSKFIFGPSTWIRGLIKPPPGYAVAYIDWSSQEVGIAAALSGDEKMMADFLTGDPYIAFGVQAGLLPVGAKKSDPGVKEVRDIIKTCVLGILYGMGSRTLAFRINRGELFARQLLSAHRERYQKFWAMADAAPACAMLDYPLNTVFGWRVRPGLDPNPRSMMNFPMQANGAEMMRLAACLGTERGIEVCAPVHDAFLICSPLEQIDADVVAMQAIMAEASRIVLNGFSVSAECEEYGKDGKLVEFPHLIRNPGRYMDKRGDEMWKRVMGLLEKFNRAKKAV
jgi:DNA polymerase I